MCFFKEKCSPPSSKMYKYYGWAGENENFIEPRLLGELFFASPFKFNDPYDCQLPLLENNTEEISNKREDVIKRILEEEDFDVTKTYDALLRGDKETEKNVFIEQIKRLGILCLTSTNDNILMWSHYASHNGICLEYDVPKILSNLYSYIAPKIKEKYGDCAYSNFSANRIIMDKVIYVKSLKNISVKLFFDQPEKDCKSKYWKKLQDWKYENEYRIGISLGGDIAVVIPDIVKHIYMGCNSTILQITEIYRLMKKNDLLHIPVSIMRKDSTGLVPILLRISTLESIYLQYNAGANQFWNIYANYV